MIEYSATSARMKQGDAWDKNATFHERANSRRSAVAPSCCCCFSDRENRRRETERFVIREATIFNILINITCVI